MLQSPGWNDVDMIRVAANGIQFEVAQAGSGERLALCLHGFPEHAYSWRHQIPMLAGLGYRVWAPNLRGYGNTDSPAGMEAYKVDTLVDDVAALIRASGARETVLIGHDWGAGLAWLLAMRKPSLISRLIIMNVPHPACFARALRTRRQLVKSWYTFFFQLPVLPEWFLGRNHARAIADAFRRTSSNPACFTPEVLEVYRSNASRPGGLTAMINWYRAMFRLGGNRLFKAAYPKITLPVLFLWGEADRFLDISCTQGTSHHVEDLTFRILPSVSHWVQQDAPEAVNAILEQWLVGASVKTATAAG